MKYDYLKEYDTRDKYENLFDLDLSFMKLREDLDIYLLYIPSFVSEIDCNAFNIYVFDSNLYLETVRDVHTGRPNIIHNMFIPKTITNIEAGAFEDLHDCNLFFEDGVDPTKFESKEDCSWVETTCKMFFNIVPPFDPEEYINKKSELEEKYPELYALQQKLKEF